jgi:hypothetical protein
MAPETQLLHATLIRLAKGMVGAVETRFHHAGESEVRQSFLVLVKGMISAWELWTYQASGHPIPREWQRRRELQEAITLAHQLRATTEQPLDRA